MASKYIYFFGNGVAEGAANMKNLLGGKGANLAEMINLGIPVPPPDVLEEPPVQSESFFRTVRSYRNKFEVAQRAHFVVLD